MYKLNSNLIDQKILETYEFTINQCNTEPLIKYLKTTNKLPFFNLDINFNDNFWDFSNIFKDNPTLSKCSLNFDKVDSHYRDILKTFVFVLISENKKKIITINSILLNIKNFLKFLINENIYSLEDLNIEYIKIYLKSKAQSPRTLTKLTYNIKSFILFYSINFSPLNINLDLLETILPNQSKIKILCNENKTKNIPNDFFNNLIKNLITTLNNENEPIKYRATACMLLLASQTGLRNSELRALTVDCLKEKTLINNKKIYYLNFKIFKGVKGNSSFKINTTYINELSKKAIETLIHIYKYKREEYNTSYLYLGDPNLSYKRIPIRDCAFNNQIYNYYKHYNVYLNTLNSIDLYPELHTKNLPCGNTLVYPTITQFRVHFCTELYNKGVPLEYISRFLGHVADEMKGYYVRPKETSAQEDLDFSLNTMIGIITKDTLPLGSNSKTMLEKINEFVNKKKPKTAKDIYDIASELLSKIPIRAKSGGACIKSSMFRECSNDSLTNKYYCAYGVCPNIFHFYYMANVSYRQMKELSQSIKLSLERNQARQAEKETNMIKTIINQKLLPELDELKRILKIKNKDEILEKYPDLNDIINNLPDIYKEISIWMSK